MPTPATTTTALADISQYGWSCRLLQQNAFNNGSLSMNNGRDLVLMVENAALSYGIANNLSGLEGVNNGVYTLCGALLQQSSEILSTGSGGIVPTPSGGGSGSLSPYPISITLQAGNISGNTIKATYQPDWYGISGFAYCFINNNQFALDVNFTYATLTGIFDFALTPYTPQIGDVFTVQAFKAST